MGEKIVPFEISKDTAVQKKMDEAFSTAKGLEFSDGTRILRSEVVTPEDSLNHFHLTGGTEVGQQEVYWRDARTDNVEHRPLSGMKMIMEEESRR